MCYYSWLVQAHSPVCSTLELHKNKSLTVFSCDGKVGRGGGGGGGGGGVHVSGGRGLFGISERGGVM